MKFSAPSIMLALAVTASATPMPDVNIRAAATTPTIYTCGDSTMANKGAADGATDGWGQYLHKYTTATVVNKAMAGRSARSYTNDGRFDAVAALVKAGDIVLIEFGHNDGGTPEVNDNNRSDCPGFGTQTCISSKDGSTVYTFVYYVAQAAKKMVAKGAKVVLSTQTPSNPWEGGKFTYGPGNFVQYMRKVKEAVNSSSVTYVDHFNAVALMDQKLGLAATTAFFPNDHTHTSPTGADMVAKAFAQAIATSMNGTTALKPYIVSNYEKVY